MKFDLNSVFSQAKNVIDKANEVVSNSDTIKIMGKKILGEKNGDKLIQGISQLKGVIDKSEKFIGKDPKEILNNAIQSGIKTTINADNDNDKIEYIEDSKDIEDIEVYEVPENEDSNVVSKDYENIGFSTSSLQSLTTGAQVTEALEILYKEMNETIKFCEEQKTKREEIIQNANVRIAQVNQMTGLIKDYLEKTFDERSKIFDNYFNVLDVAIEKGDTNLMSSTLQSINSLATSSPFKDLNDLGKVTQCLSSGGEWDI